MEINVYYLHSAIFFAAVLYFYIKYISLQRERAKFNLYKVRDDLVYLVASGVIEETDPVFSYYYKRINSILSMAPNVGIDDLLNVMFNDSKNFERSISKAKKEVDKILSSSSAKKDEVRQVIERYYSGIKLMMLSHSNLLRIIFLLTKNASPIKQISEAIILLLDKIIPTSNSIRGAYQVAKFAEREVCELQGREKCVA